MALAITAFVWMAIIFFTLMSCLRHAKQIKEIDERLQISERKLFEILDKEYLNESEVGE